MEEEGAREERERATQTLFSKNHNLLDSNIIQDITENL